MNKTRKITYLFLCLVISLFIGSTCYNATDAKAAIAGNGRISGIFSPDGKSGAYINSNNELYKPLDDIIIDQNVVAVNGLFYLTADHKLYTYYYDQRYVNTSWKIVTKLVMSNVKELPEYSMSNEFLIVKRNGELWKLRCNRYDSTDFGPIYDKEKVMDNVKTAAGVYLGSGYYYYALKKDNTLWGWGTNNNGEMGNGSTERVDEPYQIMNNVKSFYLHSSHFGMGKWGITCFAITTNNDLYGWGINDEEELPMDTVYEQLGYYASTVTTPIKIMSGVKSVLSSTGIIGVIKTNKTLWVWGNYFVGWSGASAYRSSLHPTKIANKVKSAGLETINGTTNVYYIDKNNTLWGKYLDKLDDSAIKCMKNVKYHNSFSHVICTNAGKLYYFTINGTDYSARETKKILITSGM